MPAPAPGFGPCSVKSSGPSVAESMPSLNVTSIVVSVSRAAETSDRSSSERVSSAVSSSSRAMPVTELTPWSAASPGSSARAVTVYTPSCPSRRRPA